MWTRVTVSVAMSISGSLYKKATAYQIIKLIYNKLDVFSILIFYSFNVKVIIKKL
jgi:hypothetical protein